MSNPIPTAPGTVGAGEILFHDSVQPPLPVGRYTLSAEQKVLDVRGETVPPFTAEQAFRVDGPQFRLDPAAVHMVFPPAEKQGAYFGILPNIVFNDFSLPWARPLQPGTAPEKPEPWMALLTVYDTELDEKVGKPRTVTPAEVARPAEAGVLPPCISVPPPAPRGADPVSVVDVELAWFRAIAPTRAELPFLAHGRTVNTDGKVMLGMDEDGSFSLVVGNRQVKNGGGSTVLLVSLEGHQDHLAGGPAIRACDGSTPAQPFTRIRLVLLASWSFTALELPGTFLKLIENLAEERGGVHLLRLPAAEAAPPPAVPGDARALGEAAAREALELGYVALRNEMRSGEVTTSWFRGPLAAAPTARDHAYGPYRFSDHAVHYDPATGLFDHAYAGAWQIGRLLALSDGPFARALFDWRRSWHSALRARVESEAVEARVADALSPDDAPRALGPGVAGHLRDFFVDRFPELADELPRVRRRGAAAAPAVFAPPAARPGDEATLADDAAPPPELDLSLIDDAEDDGDDPLVVLRERLQRAGGEGAGPGSMRASSAAAPSPCALAGF
jgi:hypothetical protein